MDAPIGRVYVLSNKAMPGIIKIGFTMGTVESRVTELSSATGVPMSFTIEFQVECRSPNRVEQQTHVALARYRVNSGREYFSVSPQEAAETIIKYAGTIFGQESRFNIDGKSPEQLKREEDKRLLLRYAEERRSIVDWVLIPTKYWQEFVCLKSASRSGDVLTFWRMSSGKPKVQFSPEPCSVYKMQYNLVNRSWRILYMATFSENMAKGELGKEYKTDSEWWEYKASDVEDAIFDFLCAKFKINSY